MGWFWNNNNSDDNTPSNPYDIMTGQYYPNSQNNSMMIYIYIRN